MWILPKKKLSAKALPKDIEGGEYVDYEEVEGVSPAFFKSLNPIRHKGLSKEQSGYLIVTCFKCSSDLNLFSFNRAKGCAKSQKKFS